MFQFHQLLPEFTALENVMIPALIAGTSSSEAMRKAKETLAFLGLSERASHKPAELSGGEATGGGSACINKQPGGYPCG